MMKKKIIMLTLSVMLALSACGQKASENTESSDSAVIKTEEGNSFEEVAVAGKSTPGTGVIATAAPEKDADKEKATPKPEVTKVPVTESADTKATEVPKTEATKVTATPKAEATKAPAKDDTSGGSDNSGNAGSSGTAATDKPTVTEAPKTTTTPKPQVTDAPAKEEPSEGSTGGNDSGTAAPEATEAPKATPTPPPHEHSWDGGRVTAEATCGAEGTITYSCSCGATQTEAVPATGNHNFVEDYIVDEPRCSQSGYRTLVCTVCGENSGEHIPATGNHNYQCSNTPCGGTPSHMMCTECYDWYDGDYTECWDNDGDEICDNCYDYLGED